MSEKFVQQMKKGVLDMTVLKLIVEKDTYGYEILQELEHRGAEVFTIKVGPRYPYLYRPEDRGQNSSAWQDGEGRSAPKKYYTVTDKGRRTYAQYWSQWNEFIDCVKCICREEK